MKDILLYSEIMGPRGDTNFGFFVANDRYSSIILPFYLFKKKHFMSKKSSDGISMYTFCFLNHGR
jgi:hypothetical protein